ncbi:MAG TPA: ABC transporter permease, partial [Chitinophagaceae bacterium]|nr:ABC transporter permease [Chitinophagaceae bacterium]
MIRNYFKIAFRNLAKYRAYSIINIFGLMIGIACFLVIALYVFDELTFDRFHRNADYIYRVVEERTSETGNQARVAATSYQLSEQASVKLPGIIDKARLTVRGRSLVKSKPTDKGFQEEYWMVSTNFLQFFDFKMI